jgi:hypothetical protein
MSRSEPGFGVPGLAHFTGPLNELEFKFTKKLIVGKATESHAAFICAQERHCMGEGINTPRVLY